MRFTDFYVSSPYCTPTRAGLLTGRQPEGVGLNYLVMRGPTFTHGLDLFPTFAAMASAKLPDLWLDGLNILPLLKGESGSPHEALHWAWQDERIIRQDQWKLIQEKDSVRLYDLVAEQNELAQQHPEVVEKLKPLLTEFSENLYEDSSARYGL